MNLYVTGDTHGEISRFTDSNFPYQTTKDDFVIVAGDFGLLWRDSQEERDRRAELNGKEFTTLWCDGNHCNFKLINSYPVTEWCGGKVHQIDSSIIHLMRGQVYTINGYKFFTMGGAVSIDKMWRAEGTSWWPEEIHNYSEQTEALDNLEANNNTVDYIITHTAPTNIVSQVSDYPQKLDDPVVKFLDVVQGRVDFKHWYFGHFHKNVNIDNYSCLYEDIVRII